MDDATRARVEADMRRKAAEAPRMGPETLARLRQIVHGVPAPVRARKDGDK